MKIEIEAVEGDRAQLYQWDLNRRLILTGFGPDTQAHFGQGDAALVVAAYDDGGVLYADIPNICLQRAGMLYVYIYSPANTRTRTAAAFSVWARPKPEDYVYTETETLTYRKLEAKIGDLENLNTKDKSSLVSAVNEALKTSGGYGAVTYTEQNLTDAQQSQARKNIGALGTGALPDAINDALAQAKESGAFDGAPGKDGVDGKDGAPGADGQDGITPTIGDNGNWYIGTTDTGKSSRGQDGQPGSDGVGIQSVEQTTTSTDDGGTNIITVTKTDGTSSTFMVRNGSKGSTGATGKTGKTAYQYAQDGGYTGTEAEFAAKMAEEMPDKLPNPQALTFTGAVTGTYDGSEPLSVEIPIGGGSSGDGTVKYQKIIDIVTEEEVSEILLPLTSEQISLLNNADYWQFEMTMAVSGSTNTGTALGKLYAATYTTYSTNTLINGNNLIPTTDVSYASHVKISAIYKLSNISVLGMRFVSFKVDNYANANADIVTIFGKKLTSEKFRIWGDTKIPSGSKIALYAVSEREVV